MEYAPVYCSLPTFHFAGQVKSRCVGRVDKRFVLLVFGVVYFDVFFLFWGDEDTPFRERRVVAWIMLH